MLKVNYRRRPIKPQMTEWTAVGASLRATAFNFLSGSLQLGYDASIGKMPANFAELPRKKDENVISLATVEL